MTSDNAKKLLARLTEIARELYEIEVRAGSPPMILLLAEQTWRQAQLNQELADPQPPSLAEKDETGHET